MHELKPGTPDRTQQSTSGPPDEGVRKLAEMLLEGAVWEAWANIVIKQGVEKGLELLPKVEDVLIRRSQDNRQTQNILKQAPIER